MMLKSSISSSFDFVKEYFEAKEAFKDCLGTSITSGLNNEPEVVRYSNAGSALCCLEVNQNGDDLDKAIFDWQKKGVKITKIAKSKSIDLLVAKSSARKQSTAATLEQSTPQTTFTGGVFYRAKIGRPPKIARTQ